MGFLAGIIGNIAGPWRVYAEIAVVGALLGWIGVDTVRIASSNAQTALAHQQLSDERAAMAKAALAASEANRVEEGRRTAAQKEIVDEAQKFAARARADVVVADVAHGRLSDRANALARSCPAAGNPPAPAGSSAAAGPGILLADVLRRADERAGLLAAYADQSRAAGDACVSAYDSLTK